MAQLSPEHNDVPNDAEAEKIIRKSTRTSVIIRQAERDAIRAALQATMKVRCHDENEIWFTWKRRQFFAYVSKLRCQKNES